MASGKIMLVSVEFHRISDRFAVLYGDLIAIRCQEPAVHAIYLA